MEERWIRCNKCYRDINDSTKPFTLTQCQHVFCKHCIVDAGTKCSVCDSISTPSILLSKSPEDNHCFGNKLSNLGEQTHQMTRIVETQESIIHKRFMDMEVKYWKLKGLIEKAMKTKDLMEASYRKIAEAVATEERQLKMEQEKYEKCITALGNNNSRIAATNPQDSRITPVRVVDLQENGRQPSMVSRRIANLSIQQSTPYYSAGNKQVSRFNEDFSQHPSPHGWPTATPSTVASSTNDQAHRKQSNEVAMECSSRVPVPRNLNTNLSQLEITMERDGRVSINPPSTSQFSRKKLKPDQSQMSVPMHSTVGYYYFKQGSGR